MKKKARIYCKCAKPNQGVSLVIVLIFLAILSGLAITAIQSSTFSSRIAGNESDRTLAFQAAEAALRDAEYDINNVIADGTTPCSTATPVCRADPIYRGNGFDTTCPLGRCVPNSVSPVWEVSSNWSSSSVTSVAYGTYTGATAIPVVSRQPRYMLEYFNINGYAVYRITAVGFGANDSTRAYLQTSVKAKPV